MPRVDDKIKTKYKRQYSSCRLNIFFFIQPAIKKDYLQKKKMYKEKHMEKTSDINKNYICIYTIRYTYFNIIYAIIEWYKTIKYCLNFYNLVYLSIV